MEENKEAIVQNTEEAEENISEETKPEADNVVDDDIQYTVVVPKGEVFREPEDEEPAEAEEAAEPGPELEKTLVADRRRFTEEVNDALADAAEADAEDGEFFDSDDFFDTYKAADPTGRTVFIKPPVYDATGLPDDDITYTFVVPKGEIYKEPDPEEERAAKEAQSILNAETKVVEKAEAPDGEDAGKTQYGLPAGHPGMGELAEKQEQRRIYKQRKRNRFRTRFYVLITAIILLICWLILSNSGLFTIDSIVVQGNSHYTAEEIINMGHASPGHNIIYEANIPETKEFLENNPYIKNAEVKRRLPSTLVIKVTERVERFAFKYDDDYLVMDEDGILLKKTRNKPKTTIIQGIVVSKIKLGEKIGTENSGSMDKVLDLIKMMIDSDLYFVKVDISDMKEVNAYIYDTLVVKADYDTLMANMENGKLHLVVEQLFGDGIQRGTITFLDDGSASFMPSF